MYAARDRQWRIVVHCIGVACILATVLVVNHPRPRPLTERTLPPYVAITLGGLMTARQRRSKVKVKRARHKRGRVIASLADQCGCSESEMDACPFHHACLISAAARVENDALRSTAAANKSAKWIEGRLAANRLLRESACTLGKNCRCETGKEFFACANHKAKRNRDELLRRGRELCPSCSDEEIVAMVDDIPHIVRLALDQGVPYFGQVSGDGKTVFIDKTTRDYPDDGFSQVLAYAFAFNAGRAAARITDPMELGTALHKTIEEAVRLDQPGARLSVAEHATACSIYDVLGAYADVIKRRIGKSPLLAAPYGRRVDHDMIEITGSNKPIKITTKGNSIGAIKRRSRVRKSTKRPILYAPPMEGEKVAPAKRRRQWRGAFKKAKKR